MQIQRLKNYIEVRSADSGRIDQVMALAAFVSGIAYNQDCLSEALSLVKDWQTNDPKGPRTSKWAMKGWPKKEFYKFLNINWF